MGMDKRFWDGGKWQGHNAFNTVGHSHMSWYSPAPGYHDCDIMVVECADGRWYVEDTWGDHVMDKVWNPYDPSDAGPHFFRTEDEATSHAMSAMSKVCGIPVAEIKAVYSED